MIWFPSATAKCIAWKLMRLLYFYSSYVEKCLFCSLIWVGGWERLAFESHPNVRKKDLLTSGRLKEQRFSVLHLKPCALVSTQENQKLSALEKMQLYILFGDLPKCLSSVRCLESHNSHRHATGKVCQLLMAVDKENESYILLPLERSVPVPFPSCTPSAAIRFVPAKLLVKPKFNKLNRKITQQKQWAN